MKQAVPRRRFRGVITREGAIIVPPALRGGIAPGRVLSVVIEPAGRVGALPAHDEEEVSAIAAMQAEHPDAVRRCLAAQGSFRARKPVGPSRRGGR